MCGEQFVAALTQGGEELSIEPEEPSVGEGVERQKAVYHAVNCSGNYRAP